jgi:putative peptide zinc metalloprotease protein
MATPTRPEDRTRVEEPRGGRSAAPRSVSADGAAQGDGDARVRVVQPPALAEGVELLGEYEGSAFKEPPRMARRADGQLVQLPPILYALAELLDGRRSYEQIAEDLTPIVQRALAPDDVKLLVEQKLAPLGIVAVDGGKQPAKVDPLLALRLRTALVPRGVVNAMTAVFKPFFLPPLLLLMIGAFVVFDVWLFAFHGVAQPVRTSLYQPTTLLLLFGIVVLAAAYHEFGHAAGSSYGGAPPGPMGVGIYVVWPAFYTDITESHRLGRGGRLRADLGGVYFHGIFVLALGVVYFVSGFEPLLLAAALLQLEVIRQMLPLLRFDGYYVVSDLVGIPDLFQRLKPILLSLIPFRAPDPKVTELKLWARIVVSVWVSLVVITIGAYLAMAAVAAPRIFATAWDSFGTHVDGAREAWGVGATARASLSAIQAAVLALPAAGLTYTAVLLARRFGRGWSRLSGRPLARAALMTGAASVVGLLAYVWWPDDDYEPVRPGETWTVPQGLAAVAQTAAGEPATALARSAEDVDVSDPGTDEGIEPPGTDPSPTADSPSPSPSPTSTTSSSPTASSSPSPTATSSPSPTPSVSE